jgi:hypothetical protein
MRDIMQTSNAAPKVGGILASAALALGLAATAQTASASAYIDFILKNQGANGVLASDTSGTWTNKPVAAGGQGTGMYSWTGQHVYNTVTVYDNDGTHQLSDAYCTFYTQSVYSTYYMHYQYYALTTPHNSTDGTRTATCSQSFTFENQLGDGSYDTTMTVNFH